MTEFKPVTHFILTLDGVLVDSPPIILDMLNEIVNEYDKGPIPDELKDKLFGKTVEHSFKVLCKDLRVPVSYLTLQESFDAKSVERFNQCKLLTGVQWIVCFCKNNNIPLAVATNSTKKDMDSKMKYFQDMAINFHHVVCCDDEELEKPKPSPDIFLLCADRFEEKPSPESCLVFEDSPVGIQAACCAGMQVVAVMDKNSPVDFSKATMVISNLKKLKPEKFGLPAKK